MEDTIPQDINQQTWTSLLYKCSVKTRRSRPTAHNLRSCEMLDMAGISYLGYTGRRVYGDDLQTKIKRSDLNILAELKAEKRLFHHTRLFLWDDLPVPKALKTIDYSQRVS